ncbi:MAG: hypothetical protein QW291_06425 [Thermofilaceae archaeon]
MSVICPYLYRESHGTFMCTATNKNVDPGLMPCVSDFRTCSFYVAASSKPTPLAELVQQPSSLTGQPATPITVTMEQPLPQIEIGEKGIEEMEEELLSHAKRVEELALSLAERWKEYENEARRLVEMWENVNKTGQQVTSALSSVIGMYEQLSTSFDTLYESGELSENSYKDLKEEALSNLEKYKKLKQDVETTLKNVERLVVPHLQRVKVAEARPDLGKLRLSLMKLEQLYKEGKVSEEAYQRVRQELEKKIKWLEQLAGEGS